MAVNVLRNSLKIFQTLKETLSNSITFGVINKFGKGAVVQNAIVFGPVHHVACRRVIWNGTL